MHSAHSGSTGSRGVSSSALLASLILAWPVALPAAPGDEAPAPLLHVDDPVFDWGKVYRGEQVEHTFTLENQGTAVLIIETVKSHCGCSVADEDEYKKRLAPGEKTTVTIRLDTTSLTGTVKKDTDVITNDAAGETKLWMRGDVVELLALDPTLPRVEVVRASLVPPEPTRITVTPNLGKTVTLRRVKARKGLLTPRLEVVERGKKYRIVLLPARDLGDEVFQKESLECLVEVDDEELLLRLDVSVVLKDRIEVRPSKSVYIHRRDTAALREPEPEPVTKSLEITSIGGPGHRFEIKATSSRKGVFQTRVEPIEKDRSYRLIVTLEKIPEDAGRFVKDTIEVSTNDPEVPLLEIPAMAQF